VISYTLIFIKISTYVGQFHAWLELLMLLNLMLHI